MLRYINKSLKRRSRHHHCNFEKGVDAKSVCNVLAQKLVRESKCLEIFEFEFLIVADHFDEFVRQILNTEIGGELLHDKSTTDRSQGVRGSNLWSAMVAAMLCICPWLC